MIVTYFKSIRRNIFFPILTIFLVLNFNWGVSQNVPFHKGVNLANWFEKEATSAQKIKFTKFTKTDFEQLKSLGCDVVRIPIHMPAMSNGAPDYTLDPLFFSLLDQVVTWSEELGIHLIFDNHSSGDYGTVTDPNVGPILKKIWTQMASHYRGASTLIYYEILNEPHDIDNDLWNTIQQEVITTIRTIDKKHAIIIGPTNWNHYKNLDSMYVYNDDNLIYTFHFYDPFLFTGQGTVTSNLTKISGIPFPYSAERMPAILPEYVGTWMEEYLNNYKNEGNVAAVQALIDIAVQFRDKRKVPIYCGEFGAYDKYCTETDRVFWYKTVRSYLDEKNIPWTIWDYHSNFGLFKKGADYYGLFEHDLNIPLVNALGFIVPEQTPLTIVADTTGFPIYIDYVDPNIIEKSYGSGKLNFYSTDNPMEGKYCINWEGGSQYSSIAFGFNPVKNLSDLAKKDYAVSVWIKGNNPNGQFEMRFLDTKTTIPNDHPWRKSKTISKNNVKWDNQWHQLIIPLSEFVETGSWDEAWYNPEGKFDLTVVDQLEIANEQMAMGIFSLRIDKFEIIKINVSILVSALPIVGGSVSGGGTSNYGSTVTVKATPNAGYSFVNWTENGTSVSTNLSYSFNVNTNRTLVANFTLNTHTILVSALPVVGGSVSGGGTNNYGVIVTLKATPNTGYKFVNWTENGTSVNTNPTFSFTVNNDKILVANFTDVTGIADQSISNIYIYPNPVKEVLNIEAPIDNVIFVSVFDCLGRQLIISREKTVNILHLKPGLYFVKVNDKMFKIVKE